MRRSSPPLRQEVPVEQVAPSPLIACALLEAIVKHALFIHGQIPSPFDAVVKELHASVAHPVGRCSKASRQRAMLRKARRLTDTANALFARLPGAIHAVAAAEQEAEQEAEGLCSAPAPLVAAIVIGSAPTSPRVVFVVRIARGTPAEDAVHEEPPAPSELNAARRRLVRALMTSCGELAAAKVGLSRLHLLLQAPRDAQLPAPFKPRPALRLKLKRAHACRVDLGPTQPPVPTPPEAEGEAAAEGAPESFVRAVWCGAPMDGLESDGPRRAVGAASAAPPASHIWFQASGAALRGFAV